MQGVEESRELIEFIRRSPSPFHAVAEVRRRLDAAGFSYLDEGDAWHVEPGGSYYTTRNGSSLVAFSIPADLPAGVHFQMTAAHTDAPTFKLKTVPTLEGPASYVRLDVEAYGGMIDSTWLDRPLGLAGRVLVRDADGRGATSRLFSPDRDLVLIPNVAIHFNREVNKGYAFNRQVDLCPLFSAGELRAGDFDRLVAAELGVEPEAILARELCLVNRQPGRVWGWADEFTSTPKLDDLQCAFSSVEALLAAGTPVGHINVCALFDNEEVGSGTKQGALSTFLRDVLVRLCGALGLGQEDYLRALAGSMLVSCDNAHALHPNHPEKHDEANRALLNRGLVVKEAANQKYTTDAFSRAVLRAVCDDAGVPLQTFANRSDSAGGSTLGNLSNEQVSVHAVDVGLPQLAMHSSYETTGTADTALGIAALRAFFSRDVRIRGAEGFELA